MKTSGETGKREAFTAEKQDVATREQASVMVRLLYNIVNKISTDSRLLSWKFMPAKRQRQPIYIVQNFSKSPFSGGLFSMLAPTRMGIRSPIRDSFQN